MPNASLKPFLAFVLVCVVLLLYHLYPLSHDCQPFHDGEVLHEHEMRIVAIGDLHGDLPRALMSLKMSGVIDDDLRWTGDVDVLVQTGDILDRGNDTIALYHLMDDLRTQAQAVGGNVLSNLGNHEYMNAIGDWRYVYPSEIKTFGTIADRQRQLSTGWLGKTWRANYSVTTRLPLHPSLGPPNTDHVPNSSPLSHAALSFVHGGISPSYLAATPYPSRINALGASLLHKLQHREQPPPYPPNPYPGLPDEADDEERELYGVNGPLWYRGWALDDEEKVCGEIDSVLEKLGVRRLVMGHTEDLERIVTRCGAKIILIDTGITTVYGGVLSALDVRYSLTPVGNFGDGDAISASSRQFPLRSVVRYIEKETIHAVYEHRRDLILSTSRQIIISD